MAKLFTHHDKFHAHAMLGCLALLNFFCRFTHLFAHMSESFDMTYFSGMCLLVHFMLHATSFQFLLPRQRNFSQPMIWQEFRAHNAIFAYRHLICCTIGIIFPQWWYRNPTFLSVLIKVGIVTATMAAADKVSYMIGSTEERTTNSMPYYDGIEPSVKNAAKRFYSKSQFAATALCIFGSPTLAFCSVFAIEIASFLMTLVRKGIIKARTYHVIYSFGLFIMFPAMLTTFFGGDHEAGMGTFRALGAAAIAVRLRLGWHLNKHLVWSMSIVMTYYLTLPAVSMGEALGLGPFGVAWIGMFTSIFDTLICFVGIHRYGETVSKDTQFFGRLWQAVKLS